jgi:hypothetical protein
MRVHDKDKEILMNQNQQLQKELEAIKVSVAYIHQVYSDVLFVAYKRIT